jgi:glc operon protein GlcG
MKTTHTLDHGEAQRIVAAVVAEAEKRGQTIVIAVGDAHGELLAFLRMDGAPLTSITIALNKVFSAARDRKTTLAIGENLRSKGYDIAYYGDPRFVGWGGGVPVFVDGEVIGAVAVSGLSQADDEALAQLGIDAR